MKIKKEDKYDVIDSSIVSLMELIENGSLLGFTGFYWVLTTNVQVSVRLKGSFIEFTGFWFGFD